MLGFSNNNGSGASKHTQQKAAPTAEKKPETIIHPINAPRTIAGSDGYPVDFNQFQFAGATIELVASQRADGTPVRRPAVVAMMVRRRNEGDTFIEEEMTASVKDLQNFFDMKTRERGHHDTHAISQALNAFYENKIPRHQHELPRAQMVEPTQAMSLFAKLN